jgi:hypothetical protein
LVVRRCLAELEIPRASPHEEFPELLFPPPPNNREMDSHMLSNIFEREFSTKHSHRRNSCPVEFDAFESAPLAALGRLFTGKQAILALRLDPPSADLVPRYSKIFRGIGKLDSLVEHLEGSLSNVIHGEPTYTK